MANRPYDRSIEDFERAKFEESRYGSGYYPQFSPWSAQQGTNPWSQLDPGYGRQYGQPFGNIFGQPFSPHSATPINPGLQSSFPPMGGGFYGSPQAQYGSIIDPVLQLLRQLFTQGPGFNQPFSGVPGTYNPFLTQFGLNQPFQTQTSVHPLEALRFGLPTGMQQSEFARPYGISRNVRRGPKGYKRPDELIRDDISERIALHPYLDATNCEVTVKDGEVTIRGNVDDRISKTILEEVVESVFGVKDVIIDVRVGQPLEGAMRETEMAGTKSAREK